MIAQIRHVGHEQGSWPRARHRLEMVVHHRHADRQCVVEAEAHIANTVADQEHVDHRVGQACRDSIIGRGHHQPATVPGPLLQQRDCDRWCIR